jgi:hypothetical protein
MTISPDLINGLFEFGGSILLWKNVRQLNKDKEIKGVHWAPTMFFFLWGLWNLFYYPSLQQWASFMGGMSIVIANGVWVAQMLHYDGTLKRIKDKCQHLLNKLKPA